MTVQVKGIFSKFCFLTIEDNQSINRLIIQINDFFGMFWDGLTYIVVMEN